MADQYEEEKRVMNWGGVGLIIIGALLLIFGIYNFMGIFSNFPDFTGTFNVDTFISDLMGTLIWGMGFTMAGGLMLGVGIYLIQVANVRKITKYFSTEMGPATSRMTGAMTRGFRNAGGIPINQNFEGTPLVKIRCQSCGALNDELAVQCAQCARKL